VLRSSQAPPWTGRTAAFAAVALLLPLTLDLWGGRYIGSGDTAPAELLPIAVIEHHALRFDSFVAAGQPLPYWFRVKNGRVVSDYPILPGLLNVPVFAVAKVAGVPLFENRFRLSLLTAAALVSFSTLFLFLALRRICASDIEALGFALLFFAGTEVWSVAGKGLFQHGPSLFFLTLALWLLLEETPRAAALAGLSLGLAVTVRPTNVLIALPLAFYALRSRRRGRGAFLSLLVLPVLAQAALASRFWGDPFSLARSRVPSAFSGNATQGLAGLLLSPSRGLFVFSPFLLFAIPASVAAWRRSGALFDRCLVVAVAFTLAAFARWRIWWGGHSFGYRLLIELLPLLILLIAGFWPEIARSRAGVALFGGLAAASVFVQWLGVAVYPSGFNQNIDREPERLWLLRDSEIPLLVGKVFGRQSALPVEGPSSGGLRPSRLPTPQPRWWNEAANNDALLASLDWPRPEASVRGALRVSGWAGSAAGPVEVQILTSPGDRVVPVERGPRLDVCSGIPDLRDCSRIGFFATLPAPTAPVQEELLVVELRGPAGSVRRLPPVRVFRRTP
jgi:hypothetical protein